MKTQEEIENEEYKKELLRYTFACGRDPENFNIDDFPRVKARMEAQAKQTQTDRAAVNVLKPKNHVDIWLENSLKEDNEKFNIKNDYIDSWVVED